MKPVESSKNNESNSKESELKDIWAIRPCNFYKEEYSDCKSIKARFHQYFVFGEFIDCTQWKEDYDNCIEFENTKEPAVGAKIIKSEEIRRCTRLKAHYDNDVWKRRTSPPANWDKPLPDWLNEKNKNTFLEIKAKELKEGVQSPSEERTFCSIM